MESDRHSFHLGIVPLGLRQTTSLSTSAIESIQYNICVMISVIKKKTKDRYVYISPQDLWIVVIFLIWFTTELKFCLSQCRS